MGVRWFNVSFLFILTALSSCATPSTPFKFYKGELKPEQLSHVKMQRGFGEPSLILKNCDGKDASQYPAMRDIPKNTYRYEPELIAIEAGQHSFGVLFSFIDIANKPVTNNITSILSEKYLVNPSAENAKYATVKHYEEISFNVLPHKFYSIQYQFNGKELSYFVEECTVEGQGCAKKIIDLSNRATKVVYSSTYPHPTEASQF